MKSYSIFAFGQPLKERTEPEFEPHGSEVILRVKAAGVCHSDIHIWEGGYDLGHGRKLSITDRGVKLPLTLGHESVGAVVALGPDATGVALGQNYLVHPWIGCGTCEICRSGQENYCSNSCNIGVHCDGGYAEYVRVPKPRYLIPIGDLDPAEVAPYACSGITAYSALKKLGEDIHRQPVVIIGAGGLGLMALNILRAMGGIGAVIVDIDPAKRQMALEAGALAAIDGTAGDLLAQVKAAAGETCQSAIDFVGSPETAELGFNLLAKGGKLVMVGLFGGITPWSLALIAVKGISIIGNLVGNLEDTQELVALARAGRLKPIPVTRLPLEKANDALLGLRQGKFIGRAVLCPEQPA